MRETGRRRLSRRARNEERAAALLMSPVMLYLILLMLVPIGWAVYLSLTTVKKGEYIYAGLVNYGTILKDKAFYHSLWITLVYTFFSVAGKVIFGIFWALVLNAPIRMRNVFRSLLILPWSIPTIISILTWRWMYADAGGVLSYLMQALGLSRTPVYWLSTGPLAMFSVCVVNIWRGIPFVGISVLAGLQTTSIDLTEAALIDGANVFQRFFKVTIPQVKDTILLSSLVTTLWTINDFELVYLLTRGGPAAATELIAVYSYRTGFINLNVPVALAATLLTVPIMILLVELATRKTLKVEV